MVSVHSKMVSNLGDGRKGATKRNASERAMVPRQHSTIAAMDPRNVTAYHVDQANWSVENLPEILYTFKPPTFEARLPEPGRMSYTIHDQYLRNIPVLPDTISSDVEEFRVEAWMRLDRRVRLVDITDRMHPDFRIKPNALQQRGVRFRKAFCMLAWGSGNKKTAETAAELVNEMRKHCIDPELNSTRGLTPGLIRPELGEAGGRIPVPAQYMRKRFGNKTPAAKQIVVTSGHENKYSDKQYMGEQFGSESPAPSIIVISSDDESQYSDEASEPDSMWEDSDTSNTNEDEDGLDSVQEMTQPTGVRGHEETIEVVFTPPSSPVLVPSSPIINRGPFLPTAQRYISANMGAEDLYLCSPLEIGQRMVWMTKWEPITPTRGIYPLPEAFQDDGSEEAAAVFDCMLSQYRLGERTMAEMPWWGEE